ncbi:MAG: hypothetical protein IPL16_12050 [Ignavibacteria bacterium]|nr:hypothetical protein [Ignavibacteria bacterium]
MHSCCCGNFTARSGRIGFLCFAFHYARFNDGILSIEFAVFRLDFIANFLSKPILNGYLNGLAISIIVGQFGKVFGFDLKPQGIFRMLYEFF